MAYYFVHLALSIEECYGPHRVFPCLDGGAFGAMLEHACGVLRQPCPSGKPREAMLASLFPGIAHLQNLHPIFVHFPLAFLPAACLFYLGTLIFRKDILATTAFCLLLLGAVASFIAAGSGLTAETGLQVARSIRASLLHDHKELMLVTMALGIILATWAALDSPFPRMWRPVFLLLFLVLLGVMALGADNGGRLVYDYNAGGKACPHPTEQRR